MSLLPVVATFGRERYGLKCAFFAGRHVKSARAQKATSAPASEDDPTKACLVFRADYAKVSEPVPISSRHTVVDFFRNTSNRNCLISGGNKRETTTVPTTSDLLQIWKDRTSSLNAVEPDASDDIIQVRVGGMQFPGVILESTSLIGTKLLLPANAFPSYEFTLIQDSRRATGLPPLVWVFNKLTGAGSQEREKDTAPLSLSRVSIRESSNGENITFRIVTFLEIRVKFPAVLLKILPVKKETAEAQAAEAVTKVLKKDIDAAMASFRERYVDLLSE